MVLNGLEMASGSIRINRAELQTARARRDRVRPAEDAEERFGFLLRALRFGAPPHGGIAPGIDRIAMQLGDTDNLREVVAFPKTRRRRRPADRRARAAAARSSSPSSGCGRAPAWRLAAGRRGRTAPSRLRACASTPTTPPRRPSRDEAWEAMQPFLREHFGNASEPHWAGREARARARCGARAAPPRRSASSSADVVFTGGASEADNIAILGRAARGAGRIVTTPLEHPAVSGAVEALERAGCEVVTLPGRRRRARARRARSTRPSAPATSSAA